MKMNEGSVDCGLWVVVGLVLIVLVVIGMVGVWGWIGVVLLLIGVVGFCLMYKVLGMNICWC